MGGFLSSWFGRKPPQTPVKGFGPRIVNLFKYHFRGILGVIVPIIVLIPMADRTNHARTTEIMWLWMFWFYFIQPVALPVTSLIPLFFLPMTGTLKTVETCKCYFNESIALLILTGILILLLNNSGADRRFALWLICSGNNSQFTANKLIFKCCTASFFLSIFSSRLIATSLIIQYFTPALMEMNKSKGKGSPDYVAMRHIINNAIHTSSSIGSTAIIHSSYATLMFRGIFYVCTGVGQTNEDIFNYLQYSVFAFPVALIQFLLNMGYHMLLIQFVVKTPIPAPKLAEMKNQLSKPKSSIPAVMTLHEKLTVFFMVLSLFIFFFRWCPWFNYGWATYNHLTSGTVALPYVKDSTVAAIFVVALHILPKGYGFTKYFSATKKSQLPPLKPESAILWWRFVDKNLNYGYMFLFGGAMALCFAVRICNYAPEVEANIGKYFTERSLMVNTFLVVLVASILSNCMSGVAMVASFLPVIMHMTGTAAPAGAKPPKALRSSDEIDNVGDQGPLLRRLLMAPNLEPERVDLVAAAAPAAPAAGATANPWDGKTYLGALGVGLCGTYGFMAPFAYTPAYVAKNTGKMPMKAIAKYSIGSVIICMVVLWLALMYWAPVVWGGKSFALLANPDAPPAAPAGKGPAAPPAKKP